MTAGSPSACGAETALRSPARVRATRITSDSSFRGWSVLAEPAEGPQERVLGLVVLPEGTRVVLARARLILLGQDVLELQALLRCRQGFLRGLELLLLGPRPCSRLDDLTRDAVLQLLDVPAGLFPPGPRRADASDVEEPARPEAPAHRSQVVPRPSEAGWAPVLAAAETPAEGLTDDRRNEGAVDGTLLGLLRDLHQGLRFLPLRAGRERFRDQGVDGFAGLDQREGSELEVLGDQLDPGLQPAAMDL